jgi:hypothetical protein
VSAIEIFTPKSRQLRYALGSLVFVVIGALIFTTGNVVYQVVAVVCVAFFGTGLVFFVGQLVRRGPALQVDSRGVTDRSSIVSLGLVRWDEISSVQIHAVGIQRFLAVYPRAESILQRANPVKRSLMRINRGMGFAPVTIAETALPYNLETLIDEMRRFDPALIVRH